MFDFNSKERGVGRMDVHDNWDEWAFEISQAHSTDISTTDV